MRRRRRGLARAMSLPKSCTLPRGARVFAAQRRQQLLLAIARDAGHAEDLAGMQAQAHIDQGAAERLGLGQAQALHLQRQRAGLGRPAGQGRRLGADHQAREFGAALRARVHLAGHPAGPQHRAMAAQGADLVQLVADVEDGAALGGQLAQGGKELLNGTRGQHRGRLIQDEKLRLGEQRPQDLHPLPLAHRERMHRP